MKTIYQITPFIHVPDIKKTLDLFCDVLGFELRFRESNYAYVELEGCGLRILEEPTRTITPDGKARMTVYIDVADVDGLYAKMHPKLATLPPETVEPSINKSWRQREFQVKMPDGDWLTFGSPVATIHE